MFALAWTLAGLLALYIVCSCIKSCVKTAARNKIIDTPIQPERTLQTKEEIINTLFDGGIEKFFKYNGMTFWIYKESKDYFPRYNVADVKNKIAKSYSDLKSKRPKVTDYFTVMTINEKRELCWEFKPIDFDAYIPPKSSKDICIDEINKLISKK